MQKPASNSRRNQCIGFLAKMLRVNHQSAGGWWLLQQVHSSEVVSGFRIPSPCNLGPKCIPNDIWACQQMQPWLSGWHCTLRTGSPRINFPCTASRNLIVVFSIPWFTSSSCIALGRTLIQTWWWGRAFITEPKLSRWSNCCIVHVLGSRIPHASYKAPLRILVWR